LALAQALVLRGEALMLEGRARDAIAPLDEALQLRQTLLWENSPDVAEAHQRLAQARRAANSAGAAGAH
jgi:hypothetical protein